MNLVFAKKNLAAFFALSLLLTHCGASKDENSLTDLSYLSMPDCDASAVGCDQRVTLARLMEARSQLQIWSELESQKPIYYSESLVPLPLDGTIKALNKNNYNNIYGHGYYHWILRKSAKFVQILFPGRFVTVLRVNSNYPYSNPLQQEDAHDHGLDADIGYILQNPDDPTSPIDLEAQFWFTYMMYSEAALVTGHRYSGFSYIHEMESTLYQAKAAGLVESTFNFSKMLDPWEFYHVSHFHFGIQECPGTLRRTNQGPRCQ
jgi:hypothetical protein